MNEHCRPGMVWSWNTRMVAMMIICLHVPFMENNDGAHSSTNHVEKFLFTSTLNTSFPTAFKNQAKFNPSYILDCHRGGVFIQIAWRRYCIDSWNSVAMGIP